MFKAIIAGLLGLVVLLAGPVVAENRRWPQEWRNSPVLMETRDVTLVAALPDPGEDGVDYFTLLDEVAQAWADATGFLTFRVVIEAPDDCGITTRCIGVSIPDAPCGLAEWPADAVGLYCSSEIAFHPTSATVSGVRFFNIAQHEIGHLLGLGHSQTIHTPMSTAGVEAFGQREPIDPLSVCLVAMVFQARECDGLSVSSVAIVDGTDADNLRVVMGASNDGGWTYKQSFDPEEEVEVYGAIVNLDWYKQGAVYRHGDYYHAVLAVADGRILARDGETEYVPLDMTNPFPLPVLTGTEWTTEGFVASATVTRLAGMPAALLPRTHCIGTLHEFTATFRWCDGYWGTAPVWNASLYDLVGQTVYLFIAWSDEDDPLRIFFGTEPLRLEF